MIIQWAQDGCWSLRPTSVLTTFVSTTSTHSFFGLLTASTTFLTLCTGNQLFMSQHSLGSRKRCLIARCRCAAHCVQDSPGVIRYVSVSPFVSLIKSQSHITRLHIHLWSFAVGAAILGSTTPPSLAMGESLMICSGVVDLNPNVAVASILYVIPNVSVCYL